MSIIGQQVGKAMREAEDAGTLGRPIDLAGVLEGEEQIKRGEWVSLRTLREELEQAWCNPTAEQLDVNAKDALIDHVFRQPRGRRSMSLETGSARFLGPIDGQQAMRDFWHTHDPQGTLPMIDVATTGTFTTSGGNRRNLTATLTAVRDRAIAAEKMARDVEHRLLGPMPADAKTISPAPQGESLIASALAAEAAISSVMGTLQRLLGELEQPLQAEKGPTYVVR